MTKIAAYGNNHSFTSLGPLTVDRRDVGADDVQIEILYCGVCHSDIHQARNEWLNTNYPCVPGHEIVGRVSAVGGSVSRFTVGETVAVGCMVDSCLRCESCQEGLEQYCEGPHGCTMTYNGPMKPDKSNTFGGYSQMVVVKEHFVLKVPANLEVSAVAPILCAAALEGKRGRSRGGYRFRRARTHGHKARNRHGRLCNRHQQDTRKGG
jgi:uncharacterized zinc-type alcohol dehydrogenase-like protein